MQTGAAVAKVLVVEDDLGLCRMVKDWLTFEHHMVETANTGDEGLEKLQFYQYDVVVLDWELPEMTGIDICKQFRSKGGTTPILMLTGKGTIVDKETGFDAGADDYLTKPFHMKELSARLKALLRRAGPFTTDSLKFRDLMLEPDNHRATREGTDLALLPKEFALLEFLMRHPNQVFSAEALLSRVWSSESDATIDAVSTCIKRLRKKIDVEGQASVVKTVHGVGYKLADS
jgi:DNA-binding response OmpR family regulator